MELTFQDKLYHRARHTAIFLLNLPFMPLYFIYLLLRAIVIDLAGCFTSNGSSVTVPFWQWAWRDEP